MRIEVNQLWHETLKLVDNVELSLVKQKNFLCFDLNDNFQGGETYFPEHNFFIKPKTGRLAIFTSGSDHIHGVKKVLSGDRYTLATWFTKQKSKSLFNWLQMRLTMNKIRSIMMRNERNHLRDLIFHDCKYWCVSWVCKCRYIST